MSIDVDDDNFILEDENRLRRSKSISSNGKENIGRWTKEEHELFLEGLRIYGKEWKKIAQMIGTRTIIQVRTHAQKFFQKMKNTSASLDYANFLNNNGRVSTSDITSSDLIGVHDGSQLTRNKSYSANIAYPSTSFPISNISEFPQVDFSSNTTNTNTNTNTNTINTTTSTSQSLNGRSYDRPYATLTRHQSVPILNSSIHLESSQINVNQESNNGISPVLSGTLNSFSKNEYESYHKQNTKSNIKESKVTTATNTNTNGLTTSGNTLISNFVPYSQPNMPTVTNLTNPSFSPNANTYYNSYDSNVLNNGFYQMPGWDLEESNTILDSFPYFRDEGVSLMSTYPSSADLIPQPISSTNTTTTTSSNTNTVTTIHKKPTEMRNSISLPITDTKNLSTLSSTPLNTIPSVSPYSSFVNNPLTLTSPITSSMPFFADTEDDSTNVNNLENYSNSFILSNSMNSANYNDSKQLF